MTRPCPHSKESKTARVAPKAKVIPMNVFKVLRHAVLATLAASLLSSCAAWERVKDIGQPPPLTAVDNPTARPGYKPVQMPMPAIQPASYNPNSLWRNGSRAFFKDQRAHQIGDILTVQVNITDKANVFLTMFRSAEISVGSAGNDADVKAFFDSLKVRQEGNRAVLSAILPTGVFRKLGESSDQTLEPGPPAAATQPGKSH